MSKRFTSILALAMMLLGCLPAVAQVLIDDPVTEIDASKKYVIQTHGQDGTTHWMFDAGTNISADDSMDETIPDTKYLWTITPDGDKYQIRNIASGNYLSIDGTSNGGTTSTKSEAVSVFIEFSNENCGFKNASGQYVDMSHSGKQPCTWNDGVKGSRVMTLYEVNVELTEEEIALSHLVNVVDKYGEYVPGYIAESHELPIGPEIGQYNVSAEVYNTFISNMERAIRITLSEEDVPSVEEINALIESIEDSFKTIMDSYVELTVADGNYRIVSAMAWTKTIRVDTGEVDENEQPIYDETYEHPTKAMYATMEGDAKWATIDSTDCRYLWKLTNNAETGFIKVMNIATDGVINSCTQSAQAKLVKDGQVEMFFEYEGRDDNGNIKVAFRPSTSGGFGFLHCGGHNNGAGEQGNVVGWEPSAEASQWILCPVDDETVAALEEEFAPIKNHELLVSMYEELIVKGDSLIEIANDMTQTALITKASQLSCEFGQNDLFPDQRDGGAIGTLIDGDPSTFYHTAWGGGNVEPGSHYLYATYDEAVSGDMMIRITRRSGASNDHVSKMDVYGANDMDDEFTLIAQLDLPYAGAGTTVESEVFNVETPYTIFKYVVTETSPTNNNRGYFHMAEFQMFNVSINKTSQLVGMGEIGTNLIAALQVAKEMDPDDLSIDEYDELKAAYDAAKAIFVDPTALRNAIKKNAALVENIVIGENPGFWSEGGDAGAFKALLAEAEAYDKAGVYTQAKTDEYIKNIESGLADIMAGANQVVPGKWYAIRFASEEMYEQYGWDKNAVINENLGDLYENYVAPATVEDNELITFGALEEITEGKTLRFVNEDLLQSMDQVAFRFVAQGDSAFAIQHKSGLYVNGAGAGSQISLTSTPAIFNVSAIGLGKVLIRTRKLDGTEYGQNPIYLHAQNAGHSLVNWTSTEVGSNSALFIEEIDEADFDEGADVAEAVIRMVKPNSMRIWCYPVGYTVSEGQLYEYKGSFMDEEGCHFAFNKIEAAAPGQAVLYVNGDIEDFDVEAEDEEEYVTFGTENFAPEASQEGGIHGTYTYQWVEKGTIVVGGGNIAQWGNCLEFAEGEDNTDCTRDISAGTGYIIMSQNEIEAGEYDLVLTISAEDDPDAIGTVESAVVRGGEAIFNLAGQRVVKAQKGIFIVNGKKVAVK